MTKKLLDQLFSEYILSCNDTEKDSWYCTDREMTENVLENFKRWLAWRAKNNRRPRKRV